MPTEVNARVIRAHIELQAAKEAVKSAGLTVPMGLDSAASIYAYGLEALGLPLDSRTELWKGGVGALKTVFAATVANPAGRRALAVDSAESRAGFASRFPGARPGRVV